ncbi:class I SAM-dependent methyltransferase [Ramlibacter sp. PS3R-8]|uniref:class I SAM-dependent methyltransferase n=1 Tax=Ramlibacter sp. PS3R-8 TaxID=3133437 RepID=UPI0030972ACA
MPTFNDYERQIDDDAIQRGEHRGWVGGLWEEMGRLQLEFLRSQGLQPHHSLLDVGCGALRGGIRFVEFLEPGQYAGLDINQSLINAGYHELELAGLELKQARLLVDPEFNVSRFGTQFDFVIAQSVFSHLPVNHICECLLNVAKVLKPDGRFFATFFEAPHPVHVEPITHAPGGVVTRYGKDPFHYSVAEFQWMADNCGLAVRHIGDWSHPRDQRMLVFTPRHGVHDAGGS